MKSKPAQEFLINQVHINTGYAGLDKTYIELSNKYHWQNTYTDTKEFVESCELCVMECLPWDLFLGHAYDSVGSSTTVGWS